MTTGGKRCRRTRFQPSPQPTRPLAAESPRLDHQWLISNGNHSLRGFGNLCLQAFTHDGVPTWEICRKKGKRGEWDIIAKGTADSFEAAKAAALFEAEA